MTVSFCTAVVVLLVAACRAASTGGSCTPAWCICQEHYEHGCMLVDWTSTIQNLTTEM